VYTAAAFLYNPSLGFNAKIDTAIEALPEDSDVESRLAVWQRVENKELAIFVIRLLLTFNCKGNNYLLIWTSA